MYVPFVDLKAQYQSLRAELRNAMDGVLDRGDFILGEEVKKFEEAFGRFLGVKHVIGCANGTDALEMAVAALGIGKNDEVISVANTWVSTLYAISAAGAKPVFVDIDPDTYMIDPAKIERAITRRTKAILPVHLYGQSAPMDAILAIARKRRLCVIEDTAQAHGAKWQGKTAGTFGDIACFSFYPGKNLGAYGDGGCVATADEAYARRVRVVRNLGQEVKHHHELIGRNSRLDTLQAAILRVKLNYLEVWNEKRRLAAQRYDELLKGLPVKRPAVHKDALPVFHLYVIQVDRRDEVVKKLQAGGVMAQIHYPVPVHLQECYRSLGIKRGSLPVTEKAAERILSLPIYPEITMDQQLYVAETLRQALS